MSAASASPTALDWWTFTVDAVAAVATLGAVVVALVLGVFEVRKFRVEADARAAEERRAQAEKVSAWIAMVQDRPLGGAFPHVRVSNASDEPIYSSSVILSEGADGPMEVGLEIGFVPPGGSVSERLQAPDLGRRTEAVTVTFRDASGRWWRRDTEGKLEERLGDLRIM